jgi:hypothetical protein
MKIVGRSWILAIPLILLACRVGSAENPLSMKEHFILEGVNTIVVVSEDLEAETLETGVTRTWLQDILMNKLRAAGLKVLPYEAMDSSKYRNAKVVPSSLGIYVDADKDPSTGLYTGFYRLLMMDTAFLARNPSKNIPVTTWFKEGMIRPTRKDEFKSVVKEIAMDSLDQFIRIYKLANPKALAIRTK